MLVAYGLQAYRRSELPRIQLLNLYAERTPSSRQQTALITRPGLSEYLTVGDGPIRGMYSQPGALGGALFTVSGTTLYRDDEAIGTIPGTDRVSMASSASQLLIANDTALFITDGVTVDSVVFPDAAGVTSVAYINGYFLAARADSQRFYWSDILDGETWDPLNYAAAERAPDNLVAIWVVSDQIWMFGEITTEVWIPTGDGEVPFQRIDGRLYDQGCLSRDTVAKMDNSVFWVGHDFKVYRGDSQPLRVSDNGIEDMIQASDPADLTAWAFPWQGSLFYSLTTTNETLAYNPATEQWNQFGSYGRATWRAYLGVFRNGTVYAGDDTNGTVWQLVEGQLTDAGEPIERKWTALLANPLFIDNLYIDGSAGSSPSYEENPLIEMRISRDQGNTYGEWRQSTTGYQGEYRTRIVWRRCGMIDADGGVIEFRTTDSFNWRLASIRMNDNLAGRSRAA
jgi:hypothetical protein